MNINTSTNFVNNNDSTYFDSSISTLSGIIAFSVSAYKGNSAIDSLFCAGIAYKAGDAIEKCIEARYIKPENATDLYVNATKDAGSAMALTLFLKSCSPSLLGGYLSYKAGQKSGELVANICKKINSLAT